MGACVVVVGGFLFYDKRIFDLLGFVRDRGFNVHQENTAKRFFDCTTFQFSYRL